MQKRNYNLDLIRIVALFSVIAVHFFLNTSFYTTNILGSRMFVATLVRSFFMVCVPLFMLLTGYLMHTKTLSRKYYKGLITTLLTYLVASFIVMMFKHFYLGTHYSIPSVILNILSFSGSSYSWYIEMYISFFVLIPFLNILFHNMDRKQRRILLITLIVLTSFPSVLNTFDLHTPSWITNPSISTSYTKLMPSFFTYLYPFTYYFIGASIREYKVSPKPIHCFLVMIFSTLSLGLLNIFISGASVFVNGTLNSWGSLFIVLESVSLFLLLLHIPLNKVSLKINNALTKVASLVLGAYLLSEIFDTLYYPLLAKYVPSLTDQFLYFIPITFSVFISSISLSFFVNYIVSMISKLIEKATQSS